MAVSLPTISFYPFALCCKQTERSEANTDLRPTRLYINITTIDMFAIFQCIWSDHLAKISVVSFLILHISG